MKFATNMDLVLNQLLNVVVENVASAPATGNKAGRIIFDASTNSFKFKIVMFKLQVSHFF